MLNNEWLLKFTAMVLTATVVTPSLWLAYFRDNAGFAEVGIVFFTVILTASLAFIFESILLSRRQKRQGD